MLAEEAAAAARAWLSRAARTRLPVLPNPGEFHWRADGERHMWNPEAIADSRSPPATNSRDAYRRFAELVNDDAATAARLRGLLKFKHAAHGGPIPLDEVEPAKRDRQALLHGRHELRLDLARKPTKRWPSP